MKKLHEKKREYVRCVTSIDCVQQERHAINVGMKKIRRSS